MVLGGRGRLQAYRSGVLEWVKSMGIGEVWKREAVEDFKMPIELTAN